MTETTEGGQFSWGLDPEWLQEFVEERLINEGKTVWEYFWDSGGPGAGADSELVVKFEGLYFARDSNMGFAGPFDTLVEALNAGWELGVNEATKWIRASELSAIAVVRMLSSTDAPDGYEIHINDQRWVVEGRSLRRRR